MLVFATVDASTILYRNLNPETGLPLLAFHSYILPLPVTVKPLKVILFAAMVMTLVSLLSSCVLLLERFSQYALLPKKVSPAVLIVTASAYTPPSTYTAELAAATLSNSENDAKAVLSTVKLCPLYSNVSPVVVALGEIKYSAAKLIVATAVTNTRVNKRFIVLCFSVNMLY